MVIFGIDHKSGKTATTCTMGNPRGTPNTKRIIANSGYYAFCDYTVTNYVINGTDFVSNFDTLNLANIYKQNGTAFVYNLPFDTSMDTSTFIKMFAFNNNSSNRLIIRETYVNFGDDICAIYVNGVLKKDFVGLGFSLSGIAFRDSFQKITENTNNIESFVYVFNLITHDNLPGSLELYCYTTRDKNLTSELEVWNGIYGASGNDIGSGTAEYWWNYGDSYSYVKFIYPFSQSYINYSIIKNIIGNGNITVSATSKADQTVQFVAYAHTGYKIQSVSISGNISYTKVSGDDETATYSFVMPANDITITVSFALNNPYEPGGDSDQQGGQGTFPTDVIHVPVPTYPATDVSNTGMVGMYKLSRTQVGALGRYLWNAGNNFADTLLKLIQNPFDALISLSMFPTDIINAGTAQNIKIGNIETSVQGNPLNSQFATIYCGEVTVPEYFGSYLDYAPFTRISAFLPYVGMVDLNADLLVGKKMQITYNLDFYSGDCVACISTTQENGESMIGYHFHGNARMQIPLTGSDISNALKTALTAVTGIVTGGVLAASGMGEIATGALLTSGGKAALTAGLAAGSGIGIASGASLVGAVMGGKPQLGSTSGIGSNAGFMDVQKPYLIINRPRISNPENYNKLEGYPSNIYCKFSELEGFTKIESCDLSDMGITEEEEAELYQLLKSGVYF